MTQSTFGESPRDVPVPITQGLSVRGVVRPTRGWRIGDAVVVITGGRLVRKAEIFDAYWLPREQLPEPRAVVDALSKLRDRPDLFVFTQRAPETEPSLDIECGWDNVAAVPISSYDHWFRHQVSAATRRNIRASEKRGVIVRESPFDEVFIRGIMSISDETPIRAGRKYWHYRKSFEDVQREQGTYCNRSSFLGAYVGDQLIGYLKLVWDKQTAAIMQIVSRQDALDRRPNNALLAAAVRLCEERKVPYLLYEKFVYGQTRSSSLTRFKRENGFIQLDLPSYHIPLTNTGRIALRLGLHKRVADRLPERVKVPLIEARRRWYFLQARLAGTLKAKA